MTIKCMILHVYSCMTDVTTVLARNSTDQKITCIHIAIYILLTIAIASCMVIVYVSFTCMRTLHAYHYTELSILWFSRHSWQILYIAHWHKILIYIPRPSAMQDDWCWSVYIYIINIMIAKSHPVPALYSSREELTGTCTCMKERSEHKYPIQGASTTLCLTLQQLRVYIYRYQECIRREECRTTDTSTQTLCTK